MSDLIHRAQKAKTLIGDLSFDKPEQAVQALRVFAGLSRDDLDEDVRDQFEADIVGVNAIVGQYDLQDGDDYRSVSDADLQEMLDRIDAAASHAIDAELDRIVAELDAGIKELPEDAIRETREHRDLMVPRLIQVLQDAIAAVCEGETPEGNAHFFAVFLLTEFQAQEAFPVMLKAFSLPDDLPDDLFGDAVTSLPARMLALFAGDHVESIEALVDDRELCDSLRWEAAQSYLHLVRDGHMQRDEAVERLGRHLRRAIHGDDAHVAGPLVCELVNYAPNEALEDIREAYERDLVEPFLVDLDDVKRSINEGEARLRDGLKRLPPREIDTLEELRGWAAFQEERERRPADKFPSLFSAPPMPPPHFSPAVERPVAETIVSSGRRVGRNDPCPCGSGKKFKKCCGARN